MKTEELIIKVQEWAEARNIINGCPPIKQAYKTLEECGELIEAVAVHRDFDIAVNQYGVPGNTDVTMAQIKDAIGDITITLIIQCAMQGVDFVECLEGAYNEIKDRRGTLIGGKFVKEA